MKKVLALLFSLVLLLSVPGAIAQAAGVDLSGLSDSELSALFAEVKEEMFARGLSVPTEITLREGKYIIGEDILPGTYTITCIQTEGESLGSLYSSLGDAYDSLEGTAGFGSLFGSLGGMMEDVVQARIEILGDYGTVLRSFELKTGDSATITLTEKTALQITSGSCVLKGN